MRVLIVGAGGQGLTVLDALRKISQSGGKARAVGFLDNTPELQGQSVAGLPVVGTELAVDSIEYDGVIVAIGDNHARQRIFDALAAKGAEFITVIHPTAELALDVQIGRGCYIGANATVGVETVIEDNSILTGTCGVGHHNHIGSHVHVGPSVTTTRDVKLGEGVMIGVGANILSYSRIGAWTSIMAGSLVSGEIPANVLAGGSPARAIRHLEPSETLKG